MSREIGVESPSPGSRGQKLLDSEREKKRRRVGELAGGATAECAAVCCCCPCALMHFLILAFYRVPTGLCKKALRMRKKKKRLLKKQSPPEEEANRGGTGDILDGDGGNVEEGERTDGDFGNWDNFYGTGGFWRSPSQRDE